MDVKKEKYLLYNDESKILCFMHMNNLGVDHIYFLGTESKNSKRNSFYREVINFLELDNSVFLCETNINKVIRDYYYFYYVLNRHDIKVLLDICYDYNMIPEYLSIDELINIIIKRDVEIAKTAYEPLNELQKKLKLQKY